jgi:rhodanese-related sulfurtransferase
VDHDADGTRGRHIGDDRDVADRARRTLAEILARAEARIERLAPAEAAASLGQGDAVLIDIRSDGARERDGIVAGSLHIPRTVLEWRLDPDSPWRSPHAPGLDQRVVLLCDHGFSSVLAAATLVDLGFTRAGDVLGGFDAWRESGLPVRSVTQDGHRVGELPGMGPPDSS